MVAHNRQQKIRELEVETYSWNEAKYCNLGAIWRIYRFKDLIYLLLESLVRLETSLHLLQEYLFSKVITEGISGWQNLWLVPIIGGIRIRRHRFKLLANPQLVTVYQTARIGNTREIKGW